MSFKSEPKWFTFFVENINSCIRKDRIIVKNQKSVANLIEILL